MTPTEKQKYMRRWRKSHRQQLIEYNRKYQKINRDRYLNGLRKWRRNNPDYWAKRFKAKPEEHRKYLVRQTLNRAVQKGIVQKEPCEVCADPNSQGHHPDYREPLVVWWRCKPHHMELHRKLV